MPKKAQDVVRQGHAVCARVPNLHPSSVLRCLWRVLYKKSFLSQIGTHFLWFVLRCLFFSFSCRGDTSLQWCHQLEASERLQWAHVAPSLSALAPQPRRRVPGVVQLQGSAPAARPLPAPQNAWFSSKIPTLPPSPPGKTICRHPAWVGTSSAGHACQLVLSAVQLPGDGAAPQGFTSSVPSSSLLEGMNKVRGLVVFFPSLLWRSNLKPVGRLTLAFLCLRTEIAVCFCQTHL